MTRTLPSRSDIRSRVGRCGDARRGGRGGHGRKADMANWIDPQDLRDAIAHGERINDPVNNRVRFRHDGLTEAELAEQWNAHDAQRRHKAQDGCSGEGRESVG